MLVYQPQATLELLRYCVVCAQLAKPDPDREKIVPCQPERHGPCKEDPQYLGKPW